LRTFTLCNAIVEKSKVDELKRGFHAAGRKSREPKCFSWLGAWLSMAM
jgi:hypothetical protein